MSGYPAVVLLWGADRGAIVEALAKLRTDVLGADGASMAAFNHERFEAPYLRTFVPVIRACGQMPMFAAARLVEVSDPDEIGKHARAGSESEPNSADPIAALLEYIAAPNPSTVLVLSSTGLKSTSKLVKAVSTSATGEARRFELPDARDAASRLEDVARERGVALERGAADALVRLAGRSWGEINIAFDKVLAYAGGTTIGIADVQAVVRDDHEPDVFALTDAVGRGDVGKALELLSALFAKGEHDVGAAQRLFSLLVRHFRLLFTAKIAGRDAAKALGLPPFIANKYSAQARTTDELRLRRAYAGLARLDDDFKGGSSLGSRLPYVLLQRWILDVCEALPGAAPR